MNALFAHVTIFIPFTIVCASAVHWTGQLIISELNELQSKKGYTYIRVFSTDLAVGLDQSQWGGQRPDA